MLEEVAKNHKEWILTARKLGAGDYAEDIVQELYIKLDKYSSKEKCIRNGKVIKSYIYLTLRSLVASYYQNKKGITKIDINCLMNIQMDDNLEKLEATKIINHKIESEIKTWHWYDQAIFNLYRDKKTSFRKLEKETTISWVALFGTIKKCKNKLRENVGDDYKDFINEDYELLK